MVHSEESHYYVTYYLADAYHELRNPAQVEILVLDEVQQLRACGRQRAKAFNV